MFEQLYPILKIGGIAFLALLVAGVVLCWLGGRRIRRQLRSKGFLRSPFGFEWYHFLQRKQYEMFDDAAARMIFGASRFCLIGVLVLLVGGGVAVGCAYLLKSLSPGP